jgi:ribosomal-protein-alanine N-acetyltransferase
MTHPAVIRDASPDDLPAILEIERGCFSDPWSERSFRSLLGAPRTWFRVVEQSGAVVGYLVAWHIGDEAELANLAVHPPARRLGLGAKLLDDLVAAVNVPPGKTIHLEVRASNAAAQGLYRSRGFQEVGRRRGYYQRPTEDALLLRRPIGGGMSAPSELNTP